MRYFWSRRSRTKDRSSRARQQGMNGSMQMTYLLEKVAQSPSPPLSLLALSPFPSLASRRGKSSRAGEEVASNPRKSKNHVTRDIWFRPQPPRGEDSPLGDRQARRGGQNAVICFRAMFGVKPLAVFRVFASLACITISSPAGVIGKSPRKSRKRMK